MLKFMDAVESESMIILWRSMSGHLSAMPLTFTHLQRSRTWFASYIPWVPAILWRRMPTEDSFTGLTMKIMAYRKAERAEKERRTCEQIMIVESSIEVGGWQDLKYIVSYMCLTWLVSLSWFTSVWQEIPLRCFLSPSHRSEHSERLTSQFFAQTWWPWALAALNISNKFCPVFRLPLTAWATILYTTQVFLWYIQVH